MKISYKYLREAIPSITLIKEISEEGKHLINFDKNFPIITKLYSFKYDFRLSPNYHDYLEICYIIEGKGLLIVGNKKYTFGEGDIIVLGNHELHTWSKVDNEGFILLVLYFLPELVFKPGGIEINFEYLKPFLFRNNNFNHVIHEGNINNKIIFNFMKKIEDIL
ncbi:MAG: AraC family ligand binding domain-containing protein [Cyanobacteria bacterium]|nr:AraC family ligand binding domain-containing protein [Cyanobacteriota bacterium]